MYIFFQVDNIIESIKELRTEDADEVMEKLIAMKDISGHDLFQCAMRNTVDKNDVMELLLKSETISKLKWDTLAENVQDWLR